MLERNYVLWMNKNTLEKVRRKRKAYQRYMQTREGKDYLEFAQARNQAKWACRKATKDYKKSIAMEAKKNPRVFYAYARSKMTKREGIADLVDASGATSSAEEEKAKSILNDFFSSVFTGEEKTPPTCQNFSPSTLRGHWWIIIYQRKWS